MQYLYLCFSLMVFTWPAWSEEKPADTKQPKPESASIASVAGAKPEPESVESNSEATGAEETPDATEKVEEVEIESTEPS